MTPGKLLPIGGALLMMIGIFGFAGILGPTPEESFFGKWWWFDSQENRTYLIIGLVSFIGAYNLPAPTQKALAKIIALTNSLYRNIQHV